MRSRAPDGRTLDKTRPVFLGLLDVPDLSAEEANVIRCCQAQLSNGWRRVEPEALQVIRAIESLRMPRR
jgi:hypothetical protein